MILFLSIVSFIFCIAFTVYCASIEHTGQGQSVKDSILEAWTNIAIGFSINFCINLIILPQVVEGLTVLENLQIGWIYTAVAMVRSFAIRRYHNRRVQ
jgi:cobalamin synthase